MKIEKAAQHIKNGFSWNKTDEGWHYWCDVYNNLLIMAGIDSTKPLPVGKTRKRLTKAIDIIESEFVWSQTPQGHNYWSDVMANLQVIRDGA